MPESTYQHTQLLTKYIVSEQINRPLQVDEAIKFLSDWVRKRGAEVAVDEELLKKEAGVGVVVTEEEIQTFVEKLFNEHAEEIKEKGRDFDFPKLIYKARDDLKWAEQKRVIELINGRKKDILASATTDD